MSRHSATLILPILLCACQQAAQQDVSAPVQNGQAPSGLERAAIESGVIADAGRISPVGLYQRRHEAGRDLLCVVADGPNKFRIGAEVEFGEGQTCKGRGTARRAGDKLILRFPRAQCTIVATYEGDRVALPGVVDVHCADLCQNRASMEGVAFPRLAYDEKAALAARDRGGDGLCQ